jgi:predicted flap endonuclease-1-like 5' DNA nuclease
MATMQTPFGPAETPIDAEAAFRLPIAAAAAPLWFTFFGAAAGASTWWWMTRWARELALDTAAGAVAAGGMPTVPVEAASFAPADEEIEDAVEIAAETVAEASGLVIDPVIESPVLVQPEPTIPPIAERGADDLTQLVGIGPKLAASLAERGVTTFAQIAAWQGKELDEIDKALSLKGRATRDAWVSQARRLAGA